MSAKMYPDDNAVARRYRDAARNRWLTVDEIVTLIQNQHILGLQSAHPSSAPPSGSLFLYDRHAVRKYKVDGHSWIRKRSNPSKVREDHVKLRLKGEYCVGGTYVHSADVVTMHRRTYRLTKKINQVGSHGRPQEIVLVHYLDTDEARELSADALRVRSPCKRDYAHADGAVSGISENLCTKRRRAMKADHDDIEMARAAPSIPLSGPDQDRDANEAAQLTNLAESHLDTLNFEQIWDEVENEITFGFDNEFVEPSSSNNIKILEHSLVPPVTLSSLLPVAQQVPSSMSSSNFLFLLEEEAAVMPAPLRV